MVTTIHFTGIESTPAIKQYALEKMESIAKYNRGIQKMEIDIGLRSHHHQKGQIFYAEANIIVKNGMVRVVKEADSLYKAIDMLRDHLKVDIDREKVKKRERVRKARASRGMKGYMG